MSFGKAEQLPRHSWLSKGSARRARRFWKRLLHRRRRRAEAHDPENVERRFTSGWCD